MFLSLIELAAPARVGLFVGSNAAPAGRTPLVHAEADARNMRKVFVELGDVDPESAVYLESPTADRLLEAIRRVSPGAELLIFYYSGHADAHGLLLDGSALSFARLEEALKATGAELRLELIDACRSGAMTRSKGATLGERLHLEAAEAASGRVIITSSAEWEDSHESDELGASFFTVHMATGLRGAADLDGDGQVTLSEAYRYVYARTVESTIGAGAGVQHPSFSFGLEGRGELTLTWLDRAAGKLELEPGEYVILDLATGRVFAELHPPTTSLSLPVGLYRVHRRTSAEVWSGTVRVERGSITSVAPFLVEREAYARLVRKGREADPEWSQALRLELGIRGRVNQTLDTVPMARLGYELNLRWISLMPYLSGTLSSALVTPRLHWSLQEFGLGVFASRALDTPWFTLRGGLLAELVRFSQSERDAKEHARANLAGAFALRVGIESPPLLGDLWAAASVEAALYALRSSGAVLEPTGDGELRTYPALRAYLSLGYEF